MAIENLPRPWLLAALTGLRVAELLGPESLLLGPESLQRSDGPPHRPLPRPDARRRRLDADRPARVDGYWPQAGWRSAPIASSSRA
jgi:hypothetical protein